MAGTDPIVSGPEVVSPARMTLTHTRRLGWAGLLLVLVAVVAVAVPVIPYAQASSGKSVTLGERAQEVSLPPDEPYGIYVDDADNSGYSMTCSIRDADDQQVPVSFDPPGLVTFSETESLETLFNTGSGRLTISCSVPGERVTVRPAPGQRPLVIGVVITLLTGTVGAGLLIAWLVQRVERPRRAAPRTPRPPDS